METGNPGEARVQRRADQPEPALAAVRQHIEARQFAEAEILCRAVLRERPAEPAAHHLLGRIFQLSGQPALARAFIGKAVAQQPDVPAYHRDLGQVLLDLEAFALALTHLRRAAELEPGGPNPHATVGKVLYRRGRFAEALAVLREGLAHDPADPDLAFRIAVAEGRRDLLRAPDGEIIRLFDRMAATFDEHLQGQLNYRVPEVMVALVGRLVQDRAGRLDVLDGGCGTGLCGPLLRPLARRLVGVDLSPEMLARARERGVYDQLNRAELTAMLAAEREGYDLIVSADMLVYFGDLRAVLVAAAGALRPGGLLAMSCERLDDTGYRLLTSGRYAHSATYLGACARAAGLTTRDIVPCEVRLELGQPVPGYIGLFARS